MLQPYDQTGSTTFVSFDTTKPTWRTAADKCHATPSTGLHEEGNHLNKAGWSSCACVEWSMALSLPDIAAVDRSPLVQQLLDIIHQQQQRLEQLEDEILRLKRLPVRPVIAPSVLEAPPRSPPQPGQKRPGSAKRSKTASLTITDEVLIQVPDVPPGAAFKGYEDFVVQDLLLRPRITRYRRERWQFPDGSHHVADLPPAVVPGSHFGPELLSFILHQYHHQHVTQGLLLEQLRQLGIDISAGQLNRILTEDKDVFHQEKAELLPAGLQVSAYVQADDTAAPHDGHNGYCTHLGNEWFAFFQSSDGKSRQDFLEMLRGSAGSYVAALSQMARLRAARLRRQILKLPTGMCDCKGFPQIKLPLPALSRPETSPPATSPWLSPRNRPARRTTEAWRRLSDPLVGAANLNPRRRPGSTGRSAPESGRTASSVRRLPPTGR